jgi:glycosyltransferase involved in cell wall biosynthesis
MNSQEPTVTLLLPVLNEIEGLKATLPKIDQNLFVQILMMDGGSTDGSQVYARERGIEVKRQKRPGLLFAILDAYPHIEGDYLITLSPDGNALPELLPPMVSKIREGADLVIASRYLPPARSYDDTLTTAFGNFLFTKLIRGLGKQKITDALNIYRGYKKNLLIDSQLQRFLLGPVLEPAISAFSVIKGLKIVEIPGDEPKRIGGERKMHIIYNGACVLFMIIRMYFYRFALFLKIGFMKIKAQ